MTWLNELIVPVYWSLGSNKQIGITDNHVRDAGWKQPPVHFGRTPDAGCCKMEIRFWRCHFRPDAMWDARVWRAPEGLGYCQSSTTEPMIVIPILSSQLGIVTGCVTCLLDICCNLLNYFNSIKYLEPHPHACMHASQISDCYFVDIAAHTTIISSFYTP